MRLSVVWLAAWRGVARLARSGARQATPALGVLPRAFDRAADAIQGICLAHDLTQTFLKCSLPSAAWQVW